MGNFFNFPLIAIDQWYTHNCPYVVQPKFGKTLFFGASCPHFRFVRIGVFGYALAKTLFTHYESVNASFYFVLQISIDYIMNESYYTTLWITVSDATVMKSLIL